MQATNDRDWSEKHILLQQWLATPKRERKPKTMALLAAELDVDEATLYRWRKIDGFSAAVNALVREHLEFDLPEIYMALRREAKRGNFSHIKLALELVGDYVQKIAPTTPDGKRSSPAYNYSNLSVEELHALRALMAKMADGSADD